MLASAATSATCRTSWLGHAVRTLFSAAPWVTPTESTRQPSKFVGTMKSLVKAKAERGLWLQDVPIPGITPNDLLIKIRKTAICGTDLHIFKWDEWAQRTIPVPMTVGHEFVGEVAEIGNLVQGFAVGDRVSGEGHLVCGFCRKCRAGERHLCRNTRGIGVNVPGCFGEYLRLPATNAWKIPDSIPDEIASFFDPYGNAAHTTLQFDLVGEDVLITGAGPIGCIAVKIAKHVGARHVVVTDVNDYRLKMARDCGASLTINMASGGPRPKDNPVTGPEVSTGVSLLRKAMQELGMKEGFDVGLEMSGNPQALSDMITTLNMGGKLSLLGIPSAASIPINIHEIVFKGITIQGIYGRKMFETWYKMQTMIQSGLDLSPILTHQFPADKFHEAFDVALSGNSGKVVLDWTKISV